VFVQHLGVLHCSLGRHASDFDRLASLCPSLRIAPQAALLGELLGSDMSGLDDDEDDDDDGEDEDDGIDDMDEDEFEEMLNGVDGDDGE